MQNLEARNLILVTGMNCSTGNRDELNIGNRSIRHSSKLRRRIKHKKLPIVQPN